MARPRYWLLIGPLAAMILLAVLLYFSHTIFYNLAMRMDAAPDAVAATTAPTDPAPRFHSIEHWYRFAYRTLLALLCLVGGWLTFRLLDVFFWQAVVERHTGKRAPALLVAVARVVVFLIVAMVIYGVVYEQPLNALLVSSGVAGIVLGFALQRMISDFFSGIALNFEHPFGVGDWIEVDGAAGRIVEINWRATRLESLDHVTVVVPNSFIGERRFLNYSLPHAWFRTELSVSLDYDVPVQEGKRVLLAAVRAAPGVLADPAPDVLAGEFGERGIAYRARFFIDDFSQINVVKDAVASSISQHLWQAGMSVAYPKRDVYWARMPRRHISDDEDKSELLRRVELFKMLENEQVDQLAAAARLRHFGAGVDIVQQGQTGDSLFVVVQGLLDVSVSSDGQTLPVGQLVPGQFFGEMSLLSGEPRSATVTTVTESAVYEVTRAALGPLLQERPEIAETLSRALADRKMRIEAENSRGQRKVVTPPRGLAEDLLHRIRGLFRLGG